MSNNSFLKQKIKRALYLRQALGLVWRSTPFWTLGSLALLVVQSILPLVQLYLTKLIVDAVTAGLAGKSPEAALGTILPLLVLAGLTGLASDLGQTLGGFISEVQSQAVTDYVHNILHAKSVGLDLEYYENAQFYDALHRAQSDTAYRPTQILNRFIQGGQSAVSLAGITFLLLTLHWIATLILLLAFLPGLLLRLKFARIVYKKWLEWTPQERKAGYINWIITSEGYAKEIRLFNLGSLLRERFRKLRQDIRQEKLRLAARRSLIELVTLLSATVAVFSAWGFITYQTLLGAITLGGLVMYYQAFLRGQTLLKETLRSLAGLYEDSLYLSDFYDFLALEPAVQQPAEPKPVPCPLKTGIQFEQVHFRYPHHERSVLEEVSFTIRAGETVALVGENGAGKTTLVKLLCRLYDPEQGRILLDGVDLREFDLEGLRQEISVVFQDYAHYNLSARENIGFGQVAILQDMGKIESAAEAAGADKAIERLPHGYATILGNQFEEGEELSIGEWQKIAIARAFLRQSQIVVLDEPTSALDATAEFEVFKHFQELARGRTAILISHRLSTVRLANRIFVLDNGRIKESGTHQELIELKGTYARLFETQAQYYR